MVCVQRLFAYKAGRSTGNLEALKRSFFDPGLNASIPVVECGGIQSSFITKRKGAMRTGNRGYPRCYSRRACSGSC